MSEWIEYNKSWSEFEEQFGDKIIGCLLHVKDEVDIDDNCNPIHGVEIKEYLIGHINKNRGACGCCDAFRYNALVVEYKKIYETIHV